MASLWKRSGSPYWVCCFTGPDGQRLKKSTKQIKKKKASSICVDWERASEQARNHALTETQARKVVSEIIERATGEPIQFYTTEDWLRGWLEDKGKTKSQGTFIRYRHTVEGFLSHIASKANSNVAYLKPRDIQTFRDKQLELGKSPLTANLAVKHLRIALNLARRQGIILTNPAEAVDTLPVDRGAREAFTSEQLAALLAAADRDWQGVILMGLYTGARLRDITDMRWLSVDLHKKLIRFVAQKTKGTLTIPIHTELHNYLLTVPAPPRGKEDAYVFPTLANRKTGGAHGLSFTFKRIMKKARIRVDVVRSGTGEGRNVMSLSFHSLRHTFNSMMANRGVAQEVRQKLTGHASPEMNKAYTHHELEPLRAAIDLLPNVGSEGNGTE